MTSPVYRLRRRAVGAVAALMALLGILAGALGARTALAHQPGSTLVSVAPVGDGARSEAALRLTAWLPVDELDFAYDLGLSDDPSSAVDAMHDELTAIVLGAVSIEGVDGTARDLLVESMDAGQLHDTDVVIAVVTATAAAAPATTEVVLRWEVITEKVYSHKVYVGGEDAEHDEQYLGMLTHYEPDLRLDVRAPGASASSSLFRVGFEHFREGVDHRVLVDPRASRVGAHTDRVVVRRCDAHSRAARRRAGTPGDPGRGRRATLPGRRWKCRRHGMIAGELPARLTPDARTSSRAACARCPRRRSPGHRRCPPAWGTSADEADHSAR